MPHRALLAICLLAIACAPDEDVLGDDTAVEEERTLAERVTVDALVAHLEALESIADSHDGHRSSLSTGYAQSVDYVAGVLEDAGYEVTREPYEITAYALVDASLSQVSPAAADYQHESSGTNGFSVMQYSVAGDVTAELVAVDVTVPISGQANTSSSGCEASDFASFPAGAIALVQRGTCTFTTKVHRAQAAGAVAVIVFNEGQTGRTDPVEGVLDEGDAGDIPAVGISYALGASLVSAIEAGTVEVRVMVDSSFATDTEYNVIAETPGGDPSRVVLVGAHLDSVSAGAGINDNGSGTALVLEAAVQAAEMDWQPVNKVRFAFWGAEEEGLIGSYHHVYEATDTPDPAVIEPLMAYLNYDMVASGNGYRYVYDGDGSDFGQGASDASATIERIYLDFFEDQAQEVGAEGLVVPSDSYWFVAEGIPTGGLYSGAFEQKTAAQVVEVGGIADDDHDPCYHQACDRIDRIDLALYADLAAAGAHAVQRLGERSEPLAAQRRSARDTDLPRPYGSHDHVRWDR